MLAEGHISIEEGASNQHDGAIFGQIVLYFVMELVKEGSVHIAFSGSQSANHSAINWIISMKPPFGVMRADTAIRAHVGVLIARSIKVEWVTIYDTERMKP